jgi:hypothetical protein
VYAKRDLGACLGSRYRQEETYGRCNENKFKSTHR